ncbi:dihydroorotase [Agrococcus casei]|uniref:Dihydroorotase n=1 Tax=Agrococcus casei LMG 22410 TaxID=1255656 RepID=A0A1R4FQ97_9MICO|nr:dihydroorotase [Agrococcus casei]SJM58096.1 Dihydroorotase [Agrococcus casei LMG 22410]
MTTLIRGAQLLGAERTDVLIDDGIIAEVGSVARADTVIDADGLIALPGLVDLHTHLREPGGEQSETIATGSSAAAKGGFTAVFAMANTAPVADTVAVVEQVADRGRAAGLVHVQPIGAVTVGLAGRELAEIGMMAASRARVRVFSDDGKCVFDPLLMRRALEYVKPFGGVIAQHAQEPRLTEGAVMNDSALSGTLGLGGWPAVAEESIIARDALLAEQTGSRVHICHVSTAGSVDVLRWAKARGIAITAEVTPHHLMLTEELISGYDSVYKVNPPLRRDEDVQALREAVADGTIDIVATDHAPHAPEQKLTSFGDAAFGMVGLESALPVVLRSLVEPGHIEVADIARILSSAPAAIGGILGYDKPLTVGAPANITLVDTSASRTFSADDLAGRSTNSPFIGVELPGTVEHVLFEGRATVREGLVIHD